MKKKKNKRLAGLKQSGWKTRFPRTWTQKFFPPLPLGLMTAISPCCYQALTLCLLITRSLYDSDCSKRGFRNPSVLFFSRSLRLSLAYSSNLRWLALCGEPGRFESVMSFSHLDPLWYHAHFLCLSLLLVSNRSAVHFPGLLWEKKMAPLTVGGFAELKHPLERAQGRQCFH